MVSIEDIEIWIRENGDSEGFYDTEALVNHFVNISKTEIIEKACEWLENNVEMYNAYNPIVESYYSGKERMLEDFKKIMEEKK